MSSLVFAPASAVNWLPVCLGGADLVRCQLVLAFESPDTPEACRASWRSAIMTVWAMQRLPYGRRTLSSADCWKSISGLAWFPSSPVDAARNVAVRPRLMAAGIGPDVRSRLSWRSRRPSMSSSSTLALAELRDGPLYRFAVHVLGDGDAGVTEDLRNYM